MTTVRVEAIHPKCLAQIQNASPEEPCGCREWKGERASWWLCAHHDSFNDGCWAVADVEPKTIGEVFDAMRLLSLPCGEIDTHAYFMTADTLGAIWLEGSHWYANDIGIPTASKFDRFEEAVRHLYEARKKITELLKGNR